MGRIMLKRKLRLLEQRTGIAEVGRCPTCQDVPGIPPDPMFISFYTQEEYDAWCARPPKYVCPNCGWRQGVLQRDGEYIRTVIMMMPEDYKRYYGAKYYESLGLPVPEAVSRG